MELRELRKLVNQGENEQLEFKRKIAHPEKVVREVVAFANTKGGHLLIGVDDDHSIIGCKDAVEEEFLMTKAIRELCRPAIKFCVSMIPLNEKRTVLDYHIYPGLKQPYFALEKKNHRYGKAFVRVEDRSIQASAEIRKILKINREGHPAKFEYGENESLLFRYLEGQGHITLNKYASLTGLDLRMASAILVRLVTANALKIVPREGEDWYMAFHG